MATLEELLAKAKNRQFDSGNAVIKTKTDSKQEPKQEPKQETIQTIPTIIETIAAKDTITVTLADGSHKTITLNERQLEAVNLARAGKSFVLIGAAGTGKTTSTLASVQAIIDSGIAPLDSEHKYLKQGTPGIVGCAYTRRATSNLRRAFAECLQDNVITIHKLLEYAPVYYPHPETGKMTMRFEATRNRFRPLPISLKVIIIDEASMVSVELFQELLDALPNPDAVTWLFIGDIQQLPPTFGLAILGFKLTELPVIELTEVYRQALDSPIISLAHRILAGTALSEFEVKKNWCDFGARLQINFWPKKLDHEYCIKAIASTICDAYDSGAYVPDTDIILIPFNKSFGSVELNKHVANHIARKTGLLTFEIIAGWQKTYLSIGDRVLYDKEDAVIENITINPDYVGQPFQTESYTLSYWGHDSAGVHLVNNDLGADKILELVSSVDTSEQSAQAASHIVTIKILDTGMEVKLNNAGQIKQLQHSYVMTVHKSQGSEWRKVILILHHSHSCMVARELLYTAVTRAREQLIVVCEKDTFMRGITTQRIKGNTIEEKAAYFRSLKAIGDDS